MLLKFIIIFSTCSVILCNEERPVVNAPIGRIKGFSKLSFNQRKFSSFEGIPYAKPPIGKLRFQEPEPVEPWTGTWNAGSVTECIQTTLMNPNVGQGEEDCLYLNVYVPREKPDPEEKLDVIVHIHGGAFMWGSGHSYAHPEYFMDKDVIFVTLNYRLGIFGFLSTNDKVLPGNNGMKDQVLALKWIQTNIQSFGGNPASVTLTGLSAGGGSVHLHYFSPLSKGLFHRGFSQSGVALNPWALQEEPLKKAEKLAISVGCPIDNTQVLVDCLRERPLKQILTKTGMFYGYMFMPYCPFAPVIEKGPNAFLDNLPYFLLTQGKVHDLPWITSNTEHEGLFPGIYLKENLKEINDHWTELAPYLLEFNYTLAKSISDVTSKEIKKQYIGEDAEINEENFYKLVKMFTDRIFLNDASKAAKLQAKVTKSDVYFYYFTYPQEENKNQTIAHGEDGQYMFHKMYARKPSTNDLKMKNLMIDMVVSFAKTGKPEIKGVNWEPTGHRELTYLNISSYESDKLTVQKVDGLGSEKFWSSLGFFENENLVLVNKEKEEL